MNWAVHCADVLDWAAKYDGPKFHAILTDPSYGLGDNPDIEALLTAWMADEDYDTGPGFMGRDWDQLPGPRYWRALRRCCHPGAYLFAFGGSGSEAIGAGLAGWDEVVMVEMEEEYCAIAEARLAHWVNEMQLELSL